MMVYQKFVSEHAKQQIPVSSALLIPSAICVSATAADPMLTE